MRNPSLSLVDVSVAGDRQTILLDIKNDGDVQLTVSKVLFQYQSTNEQFDLGTNASALAGAATMNPGDFLSLKFTISGTTLPDLSTFTLTVVSDQLARAFTVQA